ncbi:MAG: alpha/beta fold hydrolase [Fulvivirga sp.]
MKLSIAALILSFSVFQGAAQVLYTQNGEHPIAYQTFGKGDPLVIINGGPGMNSDGFAPIAREIAERYNLMTIIYDQRGTGKSSLDAVNDKTISMELMVKDLESLRKHLGVKSWIVMGHSFGGMLASFYVTQYPDAIDKLILSSSGGYDLSLLSTLNIRRNLTANQLDSLNYWSHLSSINSSAETSYMRAKYLAPAYLYYDSDKHISKIAERLTQVNMDINQLVFSNMQVINFDCSTALKSFEKPTLIIQGVNDVLGIEIAKNTHEILPNSKLVLIDQCAHYGWLDQPEEFFSSLAEFLQ